MFGTKRTPLNQKQTFVTVARLCEKGNISLAPLHLFQSQSRYVNQERLCKTRRSRKPPMIQSVNKNTHVPRGCFSCRDTRRQRRQPTLLPRSSQPSGTRLASTLRLWKKKCPHISQAGVTSQASHGEPRVTESRGSPSI